MSRNLPTWVRALTLLCLFLLPLGAVAQVCHDHNSPIHTKDASHTSQNECQLCIAMHSALVVQQHRFVAPGSRVFLLDYVSIERERAFFWHTPMASRPPPSYSL